MKGKLKLREIKFRGKNKEGKWIYGGIKFDINRVWIYGGIKFDINRVWIDAAYYGEILVDKKTVGQYTGLKDKNGKEIYEGDILKINEDIKRAYDLEDIMYIDFIEGSFYLKAEKEIKWSMLRCLPALVNIEGNIRAEVIGNIYNNPELLGGKDEKYN